MAKTIIVTGASRGIGAAIAEFLLKQSHNVVLIARTEQPLEELRKIYPKQVLILAGDLGDFLLAQKAVASALEAFGNLDGLIVNHGMMDPVMKIETSDIEEWRKLFDVNFFSAVAFAKAAIPTLRESYGCIVFTSSGVSTGAYSTWGAYGASKAAINHLARQLAVEEPKVTSIAVRPGVVDTDMQRQLREVHSAVMAAKDNAKFLGLHQAGKLLRPDQPGHVMARMVLDPPKDLSGKYVE
ncbi:MAG: hypothetical protein Q9161_006660 [Pseudevernia consocians]